MATCKYGTCDAARINGIYCHEEGCPNDWRDSVRDCRECGCEFKPEAREQRYCSPCCAASATGGTCDCEGCVDAAIDDYQAREEGRAEER